MIDWLGIAAVTVWLAWVTQAVLSAILVRRFGRDLGKPWRPHYEHPDPPLATVIMPMKGLDPDLSASIDSLCAQSYPNYRLIFVVESEDDPAYALISDDLSKREGIDAQVMVAGVADGTVGQKVHNQLHVLNAIEPDADDAEYWVFADSDAVPGPGWLSDMIRPLDQTTRNGVTTGYRWLVPIAPAPGSASEAPDCQGTGKPSFWSHLGSVVNGSVACMLAMDRFDHAWGGSMAMRVETARRGGLLECLEGVLTDDYPISRMCRELDLRVYFVRTCLVATPVAFRFGDLWNFAHRQYLLTRVYEPGVYLAALGITALYALGLFSASAWLAWQAARMSWLDCLGPAIAIVLVFLVNQVRASYRRRLVERAFGQETLNKLRTTLRIDRWLTPVSMLMHMMFILRAGVGRSMVWRGFKYVIRGRKSVTRVELKPS